MKILIPLFVFIQFLPVHAQTGKVDSLWALCNNESIRDTNRLKAFEALETHYLKTRPDSVFILTNREFKLAQALVQKKYMAHAFLTLGYLSSLEVRYADALNRDFCALKIAEELGDRKTIARALSDIGWVYTCQKYYSRALSYFSKSIRYCDEQRDKKGVSQNEECMAVLFELAAFPSP